MSKSTERALQPIILFLTLLLIIVYLPQQQKSYDKNLFLSDEEESAKAKAENAQDRIDYFLRLTQDPVTKEIPANIRSRELAYAKSMAKNTKNKSALKQNIDIVELGPNDVGGRTRALGIDTRNSNIILAGGASGGMWKSTNGGTSWTQTSDLGENLATTSLVQDPLNLDTWYYSTGEFSGGSARARGGGGQLYGSGIYVSNDNGSNWTKIEATRDDDVTFNSRFDYISRVEISPITGTHFFSSNALGIYRSTNGFLINDLVLGSSNEHIHADVQVASDGIVIAAISRPFSGITPTNNPGVYISTDDGVSWDDVTPDSYPTSPGRAVIGTSDSNPEIFYVFAADDSNQATLFHFDITDPDSVSSSDRTNNIPDFGGSVGSLNLQGGYNMVCEVHPTNKDIVIIGGTNLFRSLDGFTTTPLDDNSDDDTDATEVDKYWIGGYATANNISQFPAHHPDQHSLVFDPNNVDRMISGHDGGLSVSTVDADSDIIRWESLNRGYNVTQFYTVTLHPNADDFRVLGGTQDNGSPFFKVDPIFGTGNSSDISSGDGAYAYLGLEYLTTSSQRGTLIKYDYNSLGEPFGFSYIAPLDADNQLFIHPYIVNHTNEDIIFYPSGNKLFRNISATTLLRNTSDSDGTSEGWSELTDFSTPNGTIISTLAISTTNPVDVLYYASFNSNSVPQIYRLDNASSDEQTVSNLQVKSFTVDNSTTVPPTGAYIHDISISEDNGNELIAIVSNYSTESIYYSDDGGDNWTGIGGNLEPENGNGPSVRTAAITKTGTGENEYYVGTSTGLYFTNTLDGTNTEWSLQGASTIGNTVVEYLDYRTSDNALAIATHGRGIFLGKTATQVSNEESLTSNLPDNYVLDQNYPNPFNPSTTISYSIPASSNVSVSVFDVNGRKVADIINDKNQSAGKYTISFNASNLASGVYLYKINAKSITLNRTFTQIKRMTLIK